MNNGMHSHSSQNRARVGRRPTVSRTLLPRLKGSGTIQSFPKVNPYLGVRLLMGEAFFQAKTLDDIMRLVITEINQRGKRTFPSKGKDGGALEIMGVLIEITNPRARLSLTEK